MCRENVMKQQMVQKHPSRFHQKMCSPFVNGLPKMWMIDTGPHQQHLILYQVPGRPEGSKFTTIYCLLVFIPKIGCIVSYLAMHKMELDNRLPDG